ncbi:DUF4245 domain-containing protein [Micromonospora sp. LOL_023]|uniref:DUF4245 domain-containing protein n=1 Tax=Micromonospora sp. LOL_023 TaxID=3345418 RepID=UPI003A84DFAE
MQAADSAAQAPPTGSSRLARSPKDMVLSLAVLLVPILLVFGVYQVFLGGNDPVEIDPGPAYEQARAAGELPVSEPVGLGPGWTAVRAVYRPAGPDGPTLRVGYVTPDGGTLQVVQSARPAPQLLVAELTSTAQPQGSVEVGATTWQWYAARPGERALVWLAPQRSVLVVGSAPEAELTAMAAALSAN